MHHWHKNGFFVQDIRLVLFLIYHMYHNSSRSVDTKIYYDFCMIYKRNVRKYISVRNKELTTAYNLFIALRRKTKNSTSMFKTRK